MTTQVTRTGGRCECVQTAGKRGTKVEGPSSGANQQDAANRPLVMPTDSGSMPRTKRSGGKDDMTRIWKLVVGAALGAALGLFSASSSDAETVVVTTLSPDVWFGGNEGPFGSVGDVTFTPGPGTPPAGNGSAMLEIDDNGRASFATALFKGTPLSMITQMTFSSYASSAKIPAAPMLQFDIDYDATDLSTDYQGRLAFRGALTLDTWVAQDALAGTWWATGSPGTDVCPQNSPCTWAQVLVAFPNAAIRNDPVGSGALLFRLGGPIAGGAIASVDNFTITVDGAATTFDFEPGAAVNPSVGPGGTMIAIQAYGFKPDRRVTATYYTNATHPKRVRICRAQASPTGSFYCEAAIPSGDAAGPTGVHNIRVKGPRRVVYNTAFILTP